MTGAILVGWSDHLDNRHHVVGADGSDLEERLPLPEFEPEHRGLIRDNRRGTASPFRRRTALVHDGVGIDNVPRVLEVDSLSDLDVVPWQQQRLESVTRIHDQPIMHSGPESMVLKIRIHPGKRAGHQGTSSLYRFDG